MKYEFHQCLGMRLRRLSHIANAHMRTCALEHDVTENQMSILFVLNDLGPIEQGKIGTFLKLERSSISRSIKLLTSRQLVTRTPDYRPTVSLSEEGRELVKVLAPLWAQVMDTLTGIMGSEGLQSISTLEEKLLSTD